MQSITCAVRSRRSLMAMFAVSVMAVALATPSAHAQGLRKPLGAVLGIPVGALGPIIAANAIQNNVNVLGITQTAVGNFNTQIATVSLTQKNNLCVLTGDKTAMGSVEKAARQLFATQRADGRIPKGHPQREDLERRQQTYEHDFTSTILNLFDKVLFPRQPAGRPPQLASKPLDMTRDGKKPFNGEEQVEKTLTSDPLKL